MDILNIVALLAGLGVFMIGMKMMSDSMESLADNKLRVLFGKVSNNRFAGVGIGLAVTAIIQSSSATTVMIVGFVNAGVMTLYQAAAMIMGANIGTTITAQIASLQAFNITEYATILAVLGVFIAMFSKKDRVKTFGEILAGLGLLFVGLKYMSDSMILMRENQAFVNALESITNPFLLFALGLVFTGIVQSSSAVTGILISIASAGILIGGGGNGVLYVILGTNIGTCATALLSMIGTNANGKRAALIHLMFNTIGAGVFFIVLLFWRDFMDVTFAKWFSNPMTQIAMFHTFFNVLTTLLLLPFMNGLVYISKKLIKDKKGDNVLALQYIDDRLLRTPSLAFPQVIKEIGRMARTAEESVQLAMDGLLDRSIDNEEKVKIKRQEVEWLTNRVTKFLVKLSSEEISRQREVEISSLYHVIGDVERISDFANNFVKYTDVIKKDNLEFSESVNGDISEMYGQVKILFRDCIYAFEKRSKGVLVDIARREDTIDAMKRDNIASHIKRLNEGKCKPENSSIYINLISNLERLADHLTFIANSWVGEEGKTNQTVKL